MSAQEPIRFTCPTCGAQHTRGFFNGVDVFRCLRCGYVGPSAKPPRTAWERVLADD